MTDPVLVTFRVTSRCGGLTRPVQGRRSQYCLRADLAWMTISSPLSKRRTTISSRRGLGVEAES